LNRSFLRFVDERMILDSLAIGANSCFFLPSFSGRMRAFLSTCLPSPNLLTFHVFGLFLQEGHMLDFSRSYLFSLTSFKKTGSRHMRKKEDDAILC